MGAKNVYERFIWFDHRVKLKKYPNATFLSGQFEISLKTAQRDVEFMRDRLNCPLFYDTSRKGYFYKDDTFSLPLIYLSSEELSSLLIARKFLQDGSLELTFPVANFVEITMEILKHGAGVEVIKHEALREIIKHEAKNTFKIY